MENKELAVLYASYDNQLNDYFDAVLLDLVDEDFRYTYYKIRDNIISNILKDNKCYMEDSYLEYTKDSNYDEYMIRLINHYYNVKNNMDKKFSLYEVELLMIEHFMVLYGYKKDDLGYWIKGE